MKKILFSTMVIAAMASCSQNDTITEVPTPEPVPISFNPQLGNTVATRTDAALSNNVSLGVFAFNGSAIYDNINDMRLRYVAAVVPGGWFLNPKDHYYPADQSQVDFWAYGPKGNTHFSNIGCDPVKGPKFTLKLGSTDIGPTVVDVFATQTVQSGNYTAANTPITFTLKHLLTQVKFKAKTDNQTSAENYDVKIVDIKIEASGTADYIYNTAAPAQSWGNFSDPVIWKPVDEDNTLAALTATANPIGEVVSLIPGQETVITVKAEIYKKGQSAKLTDQINTLTLDGTTGKELLGAGKNYTYTITVTPTVAKIIFGAPQITDWTDDTSGTITLPEPTPVP